MKDRKFKQNVAKLDQFVMNQTTKEGRQECPAISYEEEKAIEIKPFPDNSWSGKHEKLGVIKDGFKEIDLESETFVDSPGLMLEFINKPMPFNDRTIKGCLIQTTAPQLAAELFVRDASLGRRIYKKGGVYKLNDNMTLEIEKGFRFVEKDLKRYLLRRNFQTNISLPISYKYFDALVRSGKASDLSCEKGRNSELTNKIFKYASEVFDQFVTNPKKDIIGEDQLDYMKGIFTQVFLRGAIDGLVYRLRQDYKIKFERTADTGIAGPRALHGIFPRFNADAMKQVVEEFRIFVKTYELEGIMNKNIKEDTQKIFEQHIGKIFEEAGLRGPYNKKIINSLSTNGRTPEKTMSEDAAFDKVSDLFNFAAGKGANFGSDVGASTYPLININGTNGMVYEKRAGGIIVRSKMLEGIEKINPEPKLKTLDDISINLTKKEKTDNQKIADKHGIEYSPQGWKKKLENARGMAEKRKEEKRKNKSECRIL